jgi:pimeloyl-ACP methyl ester carboxylesterase
VELRLNQLTPIEALAQLLASSFTVFVPDLPGCGRSQRPPAALGISGFADALEG